MSQILSYDYMMTGHPVMNQQHSRMAKHTLELSESDEPRALPSGGTGNMHASTR
jgi:hypothetical protein